MADNRIRLLEAMESFHLLSILVIGDLMLDQFVWGEVSRISPEAPVPVVEVRNETMMLGGAANVANNLKALGGNVMLGGVIGADPMGRVVKDMAANLAIDTTAVVEDSRPTTVKTRIIARGQQVVRVDREYSAYIEKPVLETMLSAIYRAGDVIHGILVSDYAKGVVTHGLMQGVMDMAKEKGIPVLVDPKPANMEFYSGVTIITPNKKEAEALAGFGITDIVSLEKAARTIQERLGTEAVLITMGQQGMALWQRDEGLFTIPTMAREVFDVTGAGDTVIATLALGLASGLNLRDTAYLANIAAGVVVGKVGTAVVTLEELRSNL
ncbi:MAG: D-glycero-beta-D-manno-heptose-7-phosphate kinase [Dissulfurimicrobium sp.]|uniref:D-glycero-beta-D-manno-heptose-7-phosphate kinase n=1 Tax=Dissulfurimicrobium sp. TaxID=2022436 RepID=UPI00404A2128